MAVRKSASAAAEGVTPVETAADESELHKEKLGGETAGFCAYLGPTILGVIQSGTIYPGAKPDVLKSIKPATDRYPLIAGLVVDGNTLAADRVKVKTSGNLLNVYYRRLASGKSK